jgi:anti-anti-sigma regulatory factor
MTLRDMLHVLGHAPVLSSSIRAIEEIRGVRVVRLRGPVGRDFGRDAEAAARAAGAEGAFDRPVLFDFKEATDFDSATVAYLIQALRRRIGAHVPVGIMNAPPRLVGELEISRVERLFHVFRTEEEAITELAAAGP